jgi:hypothetical protein
MIASRDPKTIIDTLEAEPKNAFKLKGTGPVAFHLGNNFLRDDDRVMCMGPVMYTNRLTAQYKTMFGVKPKATYVSPIPPNDHPNWIRSSYY